MRRAGEEGILPGPGDDLDLLAFAPHPDDAEAAVGGILALHARLGWRVGVVDLTRGEMGSNGTPEERLREAKEAAAVLGLAVRENLGLPDGAVGRDPAEELRVVAVLRRLRPRRVLMPWPRDRHPDHEATSRLVRAALFKAGLRRLDVDGLPPHRPELAAYYFLNEEATPGLLVDVSAVAEVKERAVAAYKSQMAPAAPNGERVPTRLTCGFFLHRVRSRDAYWGSLIGVERAEALRLPGPVGLPDLGVALAPR